MFTYSFILFFIGILFLAASIAVADIEYHNQTHWIIKRLHKR
jgi:hypothetical protein